MSVTFWSPKNPNFEFSNFYPATIIYEDLDFPSTEHCFQWRKFHYEHANNATLKHAEKIRNAPTPNEAFLLGKSRFFRIDPHWEEIKRDFMKEIVTIKFSQPKLKEKLLKTENKQIIEVSPYDSYWGNAKNGRNELGKILMEIRESLKN